MKLIIRLLLLVELLSVAIGRAAAEEHPLSAMRKTFLQAEQYITEKRDSDYFALSETLKDYPLYPYLHYQWLNQHLDQNEAILAFLHSYPNTRYATLLHGKWLSNLGKNRQWLTFISHYQGNDDPELQCYFAQAQYLMGQQTAALERAEQLWTNGKSQPVACDNLFDWMKASPEFGPELIWRRFKAALTQNNRPLAKQMLAALPEGDRKIAEVWLALHDHPQSVKEPADWKRNYPEAGRLFSHAIVRWLDNDAQAALATWDSQHKNFSIPDDLAADTEKRIGMALAFKRDHRAYARLSQFAGDDSSAREWRVRAALSQQNWQNVLAAVDALTEELKQQDKWQYWRARALLSTERNLEAQAILAELAKRRSFYGFLAANLLHQDILLNHRPLAVTAREIAELQAGMEFQMVGELLAIGRKVEAARQWWHAVEGLDPHGLAVAAKLAHQWQWPSMAIFTIAKASDWDDMDIRFPLIYSAAIQEHADKLHLDPALVFALIRQESAFDEFAGSSAGAMGLMQLMPETARQIAGELGESWSNDFNLLLPTLNIRYGSFHYSNMLKRFDGRHALAIAAYNAGINRVRQWLPKDQAMPADVWIETIPYKETRGYVASVIMYALIYQQRLFRNSLKIPDLLADVKPG